MANTKATEKPDLIENDGLVTLSSKRCMVALEATWEIDKLCEVVAGIVPVDDSQNFFAIRGIAARIKQLAVINMTCLSDAVAKTEELAMDLRIEGEREVTEVAA